MISVDRRLRAMASECVRNRPALLELLADPTGAVLTPPARAHMERCASCRVELADVVLMGIAVRRFLAEAREAQPPSDAWPRLRGRLSRQRRTPAQGRAASSVLGLALAAGLAVATLVPLGLSLASPHALNETGVNPAAIRAADQRDGAAEALLMRAAALKGREAYSTFGPVVPSPLRSPIMASPR
jgi:hypothetical protein